MSSLDRDINSLLEENKDNQSDVEFHTKELEQFSNASSSLKKMNNVKAKLEQRIKTISKEHKFFKDNVSCPTCEQSIEEEFRLNKIGEIEDKVQEINSAYSELKESISEEQKRDKRFIEVSKQITTLTNGISTNNFKISEYQRQIRDFQQEVQDITEQNANRNTGVINTSEAGAKDIKSDKKVTNWKDVKMDNPEISKYFDN